MLPCDAPFTLFPSPWSVSTSSHTPHPGNTPLGPVPSYYNLLSSFLSPPSFWKSCRLCLQASAPISFCLFLSLTLVILLVPSTGPRAFPASSLLIPTANPYEMGAIIIPIAQRRKLGLRHTGWVTGFSKAVADSILEPSAMPWPKSPMNPANPGSPFPVFIPSVSLQQLALPVSLLPWLLGTSFPNSFPPSHRGPLDFIPGTSLFS